MKKVKNKSVLKAEGAFWLPMEARAQNVILLGRESAQENLALPFCE